MVLERFFSTEGVGEKSYRGCEVRCIYFIYLKMGNTITCLKTDGSFLV